MQTRSSLSSLAENFAKPAIMKIEDKEGPAAIQPGLLRCIVTRLESVTRR